VRLAVIPLPALGRDTRGIVLGGTTDVGAVRSGRFARVATGAQDGLVRSNE
jgi:hypothetical protein